MTGKQLRANKQNALKGGVKTQRGKQIVRFNALKHGVFISLLTSDEISSAEEMRIQLIEEYQPQTQMEVMLIQAIVVNHTRWQRAILAEREFFREATDPVTVTEHIIARMKSSEGSLYPFPGQEEKNTPKNLGHRAFIDSGQISTLDSTYARYVTTCERQFYRALREFQRLYCFRAGRTFSLLTSE
jgi:hypothetical protein